MLNLLDVAAGFLADICTTVQDSGVVEHLVLVIIIQVSSLQLAKVIRVKMATDAEGEVFERIGELNVEQLMAVHVELGLPTVPEGQINKKCFESYLAILEQ